MQSRFFVVPQSPDESPEGSDDKTISIPDELLPNVFERGGGTVKDGNANESDDDNGCADEND